MALSHAWGPGHSGNLSIHLYESGNLTQWSHLGEIPSSVNFCECPDIFPIFVDGKENIVKWILIAGDGKYQVGGFEGKMFQREAGPFPGDYGRNHYATQTWFDGRRQIQIAWMAKGFALPYMPFNQQMTFPRLLELKTTADGPRLFKTPVREIESLRAKSHTRRDLELTPDAANPLAGISGDLFDITIDFEPGDAQRIELSVRGTSIVYDVAEKQVHCLASTMPLAPINGHVKLRLLVDRISVEVFGNNGQATMSNYFMPPKDNKSLALAAIGGRCKLVLAEVHELRSATVEGTEGSQ
jgi:fructan beta-fructosidase